MAEVFNPNKPPDSVLVFVLAQHFQVDAPVVVAWLKTMDLRGVTEEIAGYPKVPPL